MSNPTAQTTRTTKNGTSNNSQDEPTKDTNQAELITKQQRETLTEFQAKIDIATLDGEEWVETSPEIVHYYTRVGTGKAGFFIFKNIKVCEYGKSEALKEEMSKQVGSLVHGDSHVNQVERTRHTVPGV